MSQLHGWVGVAVIGANLAAGAWGGIAWIRREPSVAFWYLLRVAQATVVVQAVVGFLLLARDLRPADELHFVYGVAPLVVALVSEAMRAGAVQRELADVEDVESLERAEQIAVARRVVRRETGIMSVGALVIVGLALRAYFTGA